MDAYLTDLRAATQLDMDIKIFRMNRLGLPQERIAKRLGQAREVIRDHLAEMPVLAFPPNADLSQGFTVAQVAEKHGWPEPMVWSMALDGKDHRLVWPVNSKEKPDLIIFDPPYFDKKAANYDKNSISDLPRNEYLEFLGEFCALLKRNARKTTRLAFINADWRDFQSKSVMEESETAAIYQPPDKFLFSGWTWVHFCPAPAF